MNTEHLLEAAGKGYLITVAVETPVLMLLLSTRHQMRRRAAAGVWLTACSYPLVIFFFPNFFQPESYSFYLLTAETFAPVSECFLFWLAYLRGVPGARKDLVRDFAAIIAANAASFAAGLLLQSLNIKL